MESHPCSSIMGQWLSSASWRLRQAVLAIALLCSAELQGLHCKVQHKEKATCVSGLQNTEGSRHTLGRREPTQQSKSWECTGSCSAPPRTWLLDKTWDQTCSSPRLEGALPPALPPALPVPSCTKSFSWGVYVQLIPEDSSKCSLWKISKKKAFWAETWHITLRNRFEEATRQTAIAIWGGCGLL